MITLGEFETVGEWIVKDMKDYLNNKDRFPNNDEYDNLTEKERIAFLRVLSAWCGDGNWYDDHMKFMAEQGQ